VDSGGSLLIEHFDKKKMFGCYRTARLVVGGVQQVSGFPSERHDLQWNPALDESRMLGTSTL
jgi:hypothetical protein